MQINVNGHNYDKWEDVPVEVRQQLAATLPDADHNGVPDLFETGALPAGAQTFASTSIMVNGQTVQSASDLPPEVQQQLQQALGWAAPMFGTTAATGAAAAGQAPTPVPGATPAWPLPPGEVMLNGVPTPVADGQTPSQPEKKGWWRRHFGS